MRQTHKITAPPCQRRTTPPALRVTDLPSQACLQNPALTPFPPSRFLQAAKGNVSLCIDSLDALVGRQLQSFTAAALEAEQRTEQQSTGEQTRRPAAAAAAAVPAGGGQVAAAAEGEEEGEGGVQPGREGGASAADHVRAAAGGRGTGRACSSSGRGPGHVDWPGLVLGVGGALGGT